MNRYIENNAISLKKCGANFAYVLENDCHLQITEYKVVQSDKSSLFLPEMTFKYNGKDAIYYLIPAGFKQMSSVLKTARTNTVQLVVNNLYKSIMAVVNNGFLSFQNIDTSLDFTYIDPSTMKVLITYIPVDKRMYDSFSYFENEIKESLVRLIESNPNVDSMSLAGSIFKSSISMGVNGADTGMRNSRSKPPGTVRLVGVENAQNLVIMVNKSQFVIGKSQQKADGIISFNKAVSRQHCLLTKNGGEVSVTDLDSSNGTFINNRRIKSNRKEVIHNGDLLRVANSVFRVEMD